IKRVAMKLRFCRRTPLGARSDEGASSMMWKERGVKNNSTFQFRKIFSQKVYLAPAHTHPESRAFHLVTDLVLSSSHRGSGEAGRRILARDMAKSQRFSLFPLSS